VGIFISASVDDPFGKGRILAYLAAKRDGSGEPNGSARRFGKESLPASRPRFHAHIFARVQTRAEPSSNLFTDGDFDIQSACDPDELEIAGGLDRTADAEVQLSACPPMRRSEPDHRM
jgi:hypothetical protein